MREGFVDKFAQYQAFVGVVEAGSFSAAANQLGVAKSLLSRRVSALEERLGDRLLHRTTRALHLSDSGQHFYQRARQILSDLQETENWVGEKAGQLAGPIRLAAPMSFGNHHLVRELSDFVHQHPDIELDLDLNDREVDLVNEGFDMALRIGALDDSSMIAKPLTDIHHITCASQAYLATHGVPDTPLALKSHFGLQYTNISPRRLWRFDDTVAVPKIVARSNNGETLAEWAANGHGIVSSPSFILGDYVRTGRLQQILVEHPRTPTKLHVLFPPGRLLPLRVRALSDFLAERFAAPIAWDRDLDIR